MQHGHTFTSRRAALTFAAAVAGLLPACRDGTSPVLTAPAGVSMSSAGGAHAVDISCVTAIRTPANRYIAKPFTIAAPAGIADAKSPKISVGVYAWTEGVTDPARITACQISDTPAARNWVRHALLREHPELDLTHPNANASDVARRVATQVATARPRGPRSDVSINMITPSECDPMYSDCTCDPNAIICDGYTPVPEEPGPEPPPPPLVDDVLPANPDPSYGSVPGPSTITCFTKTQYPHISGSDVSVHGETRCDYPPALITLRVALSKQRCISLFFSWCWFSEKDSDTASAPFGYSYFDHPLHVRCEPGWWEGKTTHVVTFPLGFWPQIGVVTTYSPYDLLVRWC